MPELPEVETTRRGIEPYLLGTQVTGVKVRQPSLRWPVPKDLGRHLGGERVRSVGRRGKYLLLGLDHGTVLVHLGMSGSLRLVTPATPAGKHDHLDFLLDGPFTLRFTDPRRFGAVLWTAAPPEQHPLLAGLGPEPLAAGFSGEYLHQRSRHRIVPVKAFLMDAKVVVGVGNIYANEALHRSGIDPRRAAGRVSRARYRRLAEEVRTVLARAIELGGTTLRDFVGGDGKPGYFVQELTVYGRKGAPCLGCGTALLEERIGQRSSVFCPRCQR